ncbi:MAG: aminopeptidase [Candidatus Omnitrophica bacterium]|nr:aminopeptidase [Candidatus Omnitrophota bacterium]
MIDTLAIQAVFERSLKLKRHESCLIVTDTVQEAIARPFFEYAQNLCLKSHIEVMPPSAEHGAEPSASVAQEMLQYDVQLLITQKSISHTKARRDAKECGARIASMPMITEEIANRCLNVDYEAVRERSLRLHNCLVQAKQIVITTALGTDITFERGERKIYHGDGGIFDYRGAFGNLPEGEVSLAPINANGVYVVDASIPTFGKLLAPLTFSVSGGKVNDITGDKSDTLKAILDAIGENAYIVAELGIGTHPTARVTGIVLEDEKVLGTCHIACGNDLSFGGTNNVPIHLDGVITKPTIVVDGKKIMENGTPLGWR